MEQLVTSLVNLLIGVATGVIGVHLITWLKYIGVGEEDAARLSGQLLDFISQAIAIGLPIFVTTVLAPMLGDLTYPLLQIVIVIIGSVFGLNTYFLRRKAAGVRV